MSIHFLYCPGLAAPQEPALHTGKGIGGADPDGCVCLPPFGWENSAACGGRQRQLPAAGGSRASRGPAKNWYKS